MPNLPMASPHTTHPPLIPPTSVRGVDGDRPVDRLAGPSRTFGRSNEPHGHVFTHAVPPSDRHESHEAISSMEVTPARAARPDPLDNPATAQEVLTREQATPDGAAGQVGESRIVPPTILAMAILAICGVGMAMLFADGVSAALISIVWLTLGCLVAWIAVWGAGLTRAREEREIIKDVTGKDAGAPNPADRENRVHLGADHGPARPA